MGQYNRAIERISERLTPEQRSDLYYFGPERIWHLLDDGERTSLENAWWEDYAAECDAAWGSEYASCMYD